MIIFYTEKALFLHCYEQAEGKCQITGRYIHDPQARCFAHILGKWMHPKYKYDPNNIIVVANEELHHLVDSAVAGQKHKLAEMLNNWLPLAPIVKQFVLSKYPQLRKQTELNL
jgi:hypothetical protein